MNVESQSCCPVCTLYLRPGISLLAHLNTHPKKQVIRALLTLTNQTFGLAKELEQSEENVSDDSSSTSSVSRLSNACNTQDEVNNAGKSSSNDCLSPKSQNSLALSELQDALEDSQDDDMDIEENNINFEDNYAPDVEEDQPDSSNSFQAELNELTQHREELEETPLFMSRNCNTDPFQSNGHLIEDEGYMSHYFYSNENARISHTDPDPQLNPPQYSTLTAMELHTDYSNHVVSSHHQEHQITLDIQTDELMPAHGELSGQESLEPPEPILASIWTMKSGEESQPQTSTTWDDTVHEVSTAARNLMSLKNREEVPKEEIIVKKEVKPLLGKFVCPYCKLNFDGVKLRKAHIDQEHRSEEGMKKGLIYIEPLVATKVENDEDESTMQSIKVKCGICGEIFENYNQMTLHFIDTHKGTL